ncbi:MAG: hypothetical protein ACRDYA_00840 [Egibacteraceae bacterium]
MRDWSQDRILLVMELLGLQPAGLAGELGVSPRAVTYWLSGQRKPTSAHVLAGLARLEREAVARLAQTYQEDDPMKRDAVVKAMVGAPFALAGRPNLSSAGRLRRVDEPYVALMEDVSASFESAYAFATPSELVETVLGHYQSLMRLLDHPASDAVHRRLQVGTGKTGLLVAILARNGGAWSWSKHYTNQALDLAWEAGHGGLEACALGDLGILLRPGVGDGSRADVKRSLSYAQQAHAVAERWSPPAIRSWSAMQLAHAQTAARNGHAALSAQEQAGRLLSGDGGDDDFGGRFTGVWNEAALQQSTGGCYVRLGRVDEAEPLLRHALDGDLAPRNRVLALTDLASLYVLRKEPEQACVVLARAYVEAVRAEYWMGVQGILRVRRDLDRWSGLQCVRDLDELLRPA